MSGGRKGRKTQGVTAVAGGISKIALGFGKGVKDFTTGTVGAIFNPSTIPFKLDKAFDTVAVKPAKRTVKFFGDLQTETDTAFKRRAKNAQNEAHRLRVVFAHPSVDALEPPKVFEKPESDIEVISEAIKESVLFATLNEKEQTAIIDAFEPTFFEENSVIVKQGDPGDYFYIIDTGEVLFRVDDSYVGSAGRGKAFGELALLYDAPRTATCIAKTACGLFRLDHGTFCKIVAKQSDDEHAETMETLKKFVYFQDMEKPLLRKIANNLNVANFSDGEIIAKKGEMLDRFFIIESGNVKLTDVSSSGPDVTFEAESTFGETIVLEKLPAPGTYTAIGKVQAFAMHRGSFLHVFGEDWEKVLLLQKDKIRLKHMSFGKMKGPADNELDLLASHVMEGKFPKGHVFFEEGRKCTPSLFMVRKGKVAIKSAIIPELGQLLGCEIETKDEIKCGGHFGNDILGNNKKGDLVVARYTVEALEDVDVGVLDLDAMRSAVVSWSDHDGGIIKMDHLEKVRILGAGTFGTVWLVSRRGTSDAYAFKVQVKKELIEHSQVKSIIEEKDIMTKLDHPFIVKLVNTYKDDDKVYMLMNFYQGGELQGIIHTDDRDGLPEWAAKFYAAGILEGLSYMHRRHILYRDVKPENILIDNDGYTVIVDMGFSKVVKEKTFTFCGTPLYLAPEIITQKGHDKGADHWAWGVLLYEMIIGMTPFYDGIVDQMGLFKNIVREKYEFPKGVRVAAEAKDLITKMLKVDPNRRLGNSCRGDADIRDHPWFAKTDWEMLLNKKVKKVPFKPQITNPLDGSNFDDFSKLEKKENCRLMERLSKEEQSLFNDF